MLSKSYKFPYLSPGYLGFRISDATLNSAYMSNLLGCQDLPHLSESGLIFPQRIPREGFFQELFENESADAKEFFENQIRRLILIFEGSGPDIRYLNIAELLSRLGQTNIVVNATTQHLTPSIKWAFELLKHTLNIATCVSDGKPVNLDGLIEFTKSTLIREDLTQFQKGAVISRFLVAACRYTKNKKYLDFAESLSQKLSKILESAAPENNKDIIRASMMWRSLPMLKSISVNEKIQHIYRSIEIAETLQLNSELNVIVKKELLLTSYLTLAKTYFLTDQVTLAIEFFNKMIFLDPFDSTAYSELGLYYYKITDYKNAVKNFLLAVELGPPGLSLNSYYLGCCYKELGDPNKANFYWLLSLEVDETALSAALELLYHYKARGEETDYNRMRNTILSSEDLMSQLTDEERQEFTHG